jgi:hypothetical protein
MQQHDVSSAIGRQRRLCRQQFERPTGNCRSWDDSQTAEVIA